MSPKRWLEVKRTVRFSDTDAAGVVHFQNLIGWCHQAWEQSLQDFGIELAKIFPGGRNNTPSAALPIVNCNVSFHAPLKTGDMVLIRLSPQRLSNSSFEVVSEVILKDQTVAKGCLRHLAINPLSRCSCALPDDIQRWLEASSLGRIQPL